MKQSDMPGQSSVTEVRNAAAILLFSPPCLARSTCDLLRRDTIRLCRSRDTGGTIRRAGRVCRHHIAVYQPRNESARFRRPRDSAGSAVAGTRANLAPYKLDKTSGVKLLANDDGSDGSNMSLPWTEPSRRATCPALSACLLHWRKADT